jgi:cyanate permease
VILPVAITVALIAALLFLWLTARRYRYGRTADGAFYAACVGYLGLAFFSDREVRGWSFVLGLASTAVLAVMAFNKGELR